jgi:ubiquinol-cytochrome c reductase iron-sulfur subunit
MTTKEERDERRAERQITALFLLSSVCAIALAIVYLQGGQPQLEGLFLGLALGGVACGLVIWGNRLMPQGPYVDSRHDLRSPEKEVEATKDDVDLGGTLSRRKMMTRTLGLAVGGLGVAALFPIRSLGPNPGRDLIETPWHDGVRLITDDGRPIRPDEVPREGLVTVFPEGDPGSADGQAVLIRVTPGLLVPKAGRENWAPDDIVAYSKICTHAGCPVGLYEANRHTLLCPCHQSTFDVLHHAKPQIGPAAAPLPQLPLRIDPQGFLVAAGEFSEPVGPSFWHKK